MGEMSVLLLMGLLGLAAATARPHSILLDTDVDTDDFFALFYLLKQNRSEFDLKAVTISANAWSDAGHAVNHVYDILFMMDRDDVSVGVGGDGGVSNVGAILPNVGGYLPLIEQGITTVGYCRYRQAIPIGVGGRLHSDSNFGIRRGFLPQGHRKYTPLNQPTAQQVMIDTISAGPTTVFLIGSHTNFALFLMKNPHLKKNIERIYIMGGGVRSKNPTGCCPKNSSTSCKPQQCGDVGNLYTAYASNPYAEFNIFADPFAAYQVFHSGIPTTLVPLDATNTIPIDHQFFMAFSHHQTTYEAQYCFQSLKMARDTWFDDRFYSSYCMWDSFTSGIALSDMRNAHKPNNENEFAEMEYLNITVITSNKPYGIIDGSNPFFDGHVIPKFSLKKGGVHSGHVQMGPRDPFCFLKRKRKGRCEDGYTKEVNGSEAVAIHVARYAKPTSEANSSIRREFFKSFLEVLNLPQQRGRFNFTTQFPYYKEVFYKPDFKNRKMGKPVVFDMDMSVGDFLALIFLLKVPVEVISLKSLYIVGGHIAGDYRDEGNLFTVPSNKYAEFNMYLDPLAAKTVFQSDLEINLIPLHVQRQVTSFPKILIYLQLADKTPESEFSQQLLSLLHKLQQEHQVYHHMDIFLGEILGAVFLASQPYLDSQMQVKPVSVMAGNMSTDGQLFIDENNGKAVNILDNLNSEAYYNQYAKCLSEMNQSAVIGSFDQQKKQWSSPPH